MDRVITHKHSRGTCKLILLITKKNDLTPNDFGKNLAYPRCVINCRLPVIVPEMTKEVGLTEPPLDLFHYLGGPDHTNTSALPGLHPGCDGYRFIGAYIANKLFGVSLY